MKKGAQIIGLFTCILVYVVGLASINVVFGQSDKSYSFSADGNSVWVLNKATRKMMFVRLEKKKTWKSTPFSVPASYNVEDCQFQVVGRRGQAVFLFDTFSGMAAVYRVKSDHSVEKYIDAGFPQSAQPYMVTSKKNNGWVLDRSARKLTFIHFQKDKIQKSSPLLLSTDFHVDKCQLQLVGDYGEGVVLFDTSSGKTAFYKVNRGIDGGFTIQQYTEADIKSDLQ